MTEESQKSCGMGKGFNYCFWAKRIVAIPFFPIVALIATSFFTHPLAQVLAGLIAIAATYYAALKIDRMTIFSGMVRKR